MALAEQLDIDPDDESGGRQPSPSEWQRRWKTEFAAARKELTKWHTAGDKIVKRYLDERDKNKGADTRWNLFASNVETLEALLYGKTPSVDVARRYADAQDELARISATVLQRMLNADLERDSDGYASALEYALQDRLLPGLGNVKLRYVVEFGDEIPEQPAQTAPVLDELGQPVMEPVPGEDGEPSVDEQGQLQMRPQVKELAPAVPAYRPKIHEDVETDYKHWKDQIWSPCRTFHEVRWWAFRNQLNRRELVKRFGPRGKSISLNSKKSSGADSNSADARKDDPWGRADVWEIWDKDTKQVFWFVEDEKTILGVEQDPLGLDSFWPFPRPMVANATTSKFLPRPDFVLAEDLYNEIDLISTRITKLERAIRVAGVYDKKASGVARLLTENAENELYPIANWAMFDQGGKLEGAIAWLPLGAILEAMTALRDYRKELINALFQITGMSDIMRGEAAQTATATEQAIKARFGSVRVQRRQDEFARFASDVQRIRGEIICKHFDPETILERSNIQNTPDGEKALQAVQFLKSEPAAYRIQVKPEAVSMTDYAAMKQERTEVIGAIGGYLSVAQPLMAQMPSAAPFLIQILQWMVAGIRGGSGIEGILEQAISQAKESAKQAASQPPQPAPPDPKIAAATIKAKGDVMKTQVASQARLGEIEAETDAEIKRRTHDAGMTILEDEAKDRRDALRDVALVTRPGGAT